MPLSNTSSPNLIGLKNYHYFFILPPPPSYFRCFLVLSVMGTVQSSSVGQRHGTYAPAGLPRKSQDRLLAWESAMMLAQSLLPSDQLPGVCPPAQHSHPELEGISQVCQVSTVHLLLMNLRPREGYGLVQWSQSKPTSGRSKPRTQVPGANSGLQQVG